MINQPQQDARVQQDGRQDEFAGHLRVGNLQRAAIGAMNRIAQLVGGSSVQQFVGADDVEQELPALEGGDDLAAAVRGVVGVQVVARLGAAPGEQERRGEGAVEDADGLAAFEQGLTAEKVNGWLGRLAEQEVQVALPRFKMTRDFKLNTVLAEMGMPTAFDPGKADFSGMNGEGEKLFITAVVHKAFVEVNEEGTEAAAATGVVVGLRSAPRHPVFRADRPFVFLIRDHATGTVLFLGRVANPV